jgi:tetratricopeptide (TPR) repeat protein
LPHLKHALQAFQDGYKHLAKSTRADLVLTLVEASRFPKMQWKRFVLLSAKLAMDGLDDQYLRSRIAETECIVHRIDGDIDRATSCLDLSRNRLSSLVDNRMHATTGQILIQNSLNCIQVEDLATARKILEDWHPLGQSPSSMETAVLFRKGIILGKTLRFQGEFKESLAHLQTSQTIVRQSKNLVIDEDLRDLTCNLAETLLELDDPVLAEQHLRAEIARRVQNLDSSSGGSLLELSLAESLFAQRRFGEAELLCSEILSRSGLLKSEQLRLHIILAKLRHINFDDEGASPHWGRAMKVVRKFPNETCATRIIVLSVCDILGRVNISTPDKKGLLLQQSLETLSSLGKLAKPGGYRCWIAGLRHWDEYLRSERNLTRSRM